MKTVVVALGVVTLLFGLIVGSRSSSIAVERSQVLAAPPDVVFAVLNDPLKLPNTMGVLALDPQAQIKAAGAAGVDWQGSALSGEGHAERTAAQAPTLVRYALTYVQPSASPVQLVFTLEPKNDGTKVTLKHEATRGLGEKARALVMDFDRTVGPTLEASLGRLEGLAKAAIPAPPPAPEPPPEPAPAAVDAGPTP